jgi:serine/threonine-protein kinase ULK/ATG1
MLKNGNAVINDYGFARCIEIIGLNKDLKNTYLDTSLYMSPQVLSDEIYSSKCDVWSVGILFYEMLYGVTPWTGNSIV